MTIDFYYMPLSAPCRAIQLTAKALGVDLNLKVTDLDANEHLTPEFLKMNPQHVIPTLNDNGYVIWESRAVMTYLFNKYAKPEHDSLYPKDPEARGKVDHMLFFDMGTIYQRFSDYYYAEVFNNSPRNPENFKRFEEGLQFLENQLEGKTYLTGENVTLADFSMVASVSSFVSAKYDISKFKNISAWLDKCRATIAGYEEINQKGVEEFKKYF